MTNKLNSYRHPAGTAPENMQRWNLYGSGLENLGENGKPEQRKVPRPGPDELLVRQDACGLCFSDTKVIALGEEHPRLTGRHLAEDPVTLGHEVACTVVEAGDNLKDRFHPGQRFIVQADVFFQGKSMAYGYAIPGGLAEYSIIPHEMIDGDEGCYLLPIKETTGYAEAALVEPWACVVASYLQKHREGIKPDGQALILCGPGEINLDNLFHPESKPGRTMLITVGGADTNTIGSQLRQNNIHFEHIPAGEWNSIKERYAPDGFDDIISVGSVSADRLEAASTLLADGGVMNFALQHPLDRSLILDIGRIHYNRHWYVGTQTSKPVDSYPNGRDANLIAGGKAWFIGAAGPMGQMHVQRAIQHPRPPKLLVATDQSKDRLKYLEDRFTQSAKERGIELVILNTINLTPQEQETELMRITQGHGFDDIISMVAHPKAIEQAARMLAEKGWFNIFAGVARGTMAQLDINRIALDGCRFFGSSGSGLNDMRETLSRLEGGELATGDALAAIGGMEAAKEGLRAVKEGNFPGKTLIFPTIHNLPLTTLTELKDKLPSVYNKLRQGRFWSDEAEEELLKLMLP